MFGIVLSFCVGMFFGVLIMALMNVAKDNKDE